MSNYLEQDLHVSWYIIIYKFILGVFELFLGLGIIIFGKQIITIYESFKAQELLEDPHDLLISVVEKISPILSKHQGYIILLLLLLGIIKIIGSVGLMYRKHWGLDLLVILTMAILPFQFYNLVVSFSLAKLIFFIIDVFIALYLVKFQPKEYFSTFKQRVSRD